MAIHISTRSYPLLKYYSYGIKPSRNSIKTNVFKYTYILYRRTVPHMGIMYKYIGDTYIIYLCKIGNIGQYYIQIFIRILSILYLLPTSDKRAMKQDHRHTFFNFTNFDFVFVFFLTIFITVCILYYHIQVLEGLMNFGSNVTKNIHINIITQGTYIINNNIIVGISNLYSYISEFKVHKKYATDTSIILIC